MLPAVPPDAGPHTGTLFAASDLLRPVSSAHDLYEAVHRGTPGDLAFYRRVCEGAGSVLELGCGYGRVLMMLAGAGHPADALWGLERDEEMLRRARARVPGATLVAGDMAALDLGRRFDRILAPHSALWCLEDDDAVRRTLARVASNLAPGGIFAFDVWNADGFHDEAEPGDDPLAEAEPLVAVVVEDVAWSVWENSSWDRDARRLVARYEHRSDDGRLVHSEIVHHYVLCERLEQMLRDAGLTPETHGGFGGEPWSTETDSTVVSARCR